MTKTKYAVDAATRRIRFKRKLKLNLWCWMFMSLAVGFYILFQGYPIICSIQYSLLDWSGMTSNATFIGLQNYKELMHDELFWNAFINSFKYMVMIVPLELAVSLFLAYLLNDEKMKGRGLYRTMYFVPVVTTASVVGIIMIFILGVQGPVNHLLVTLHIQKNPINFLGNAKYALPTLVIISLWKDCGTYMIYWLAGLQGVSKDVYEAATIDGANRRQQIFKIMIPYISPIILFNLIMQIISAFKVFTESYIISGGNGGVLDSLLFYTLHIYNEGFGKMRMGYASALAWFLVLLMGIVTGVIFAVSKKFVHYE